MNGMMHTSSPKGRGRLTLEPPAEASSGSSNGTRRVQVMTRRGTQAAHAEATSHPLVVWHLWRRPDQEIWCFVTKLDDRFALTVSPDLEEPTRPMAERYTDIVSLVRRADQVEREFLGRGWREPELHEHDSRAYGRLTLVQSSCSTAAEATVLASRWQKPAHTESELPYSSGPSNGHLVA